MRVLIPLLLAAAAACHASVLVTFTPDTLIGNPGDVLHLSGSLTNNDSVNTVFLNNDGITFPFAVDDTSFFTNAPVFLAGSQSFGPFVFLDIVISPAQATGTYNGVFTLRGGATLDSNDILGQANFHVTVNSPRTGVPEPGSALLVGLGLASACFGRRRRLSADATRN